MEQPMTNQEHCHCTPQLGIKREALGCVDSGLVEARATSLRTIKDFNMKKKRTGCSCGNYRAPLYPFRCTNAQAHRAILGSKKLKVALSSEGNTEHFERASQHLQSGSQKQGSFIGVLGAWEPAEINPW